MKDRILLLEETLRNLIVNVCEDIPREQGTRHLWDAVEDAENVLDYWDGKPTEAT